VKDWSSEEIDEILDPKRPEASEQPRFRSPLDERLGYEPFDWQVETEDQIVLPRVDKTTTQFFNLNIGRGAGKTTFLRKVTWKGALSPPPDKLGHSEVKLFADTYEHGMKIWDPVWDDSGSTMAWAVHSRDGERKIIRLKSVENPERPGASIQLLSGDSPQALTGHNKLTLGISDESQFIKEESWKQYRPCLNIRKATHVATGVCQGTGWFRTNSIINQAVLLSLKNGVPMIVEEPKPGLQYVAGLDIAQKADYMAMIICEKVSGRLVAIFRVNKRTYTFAEAQVARLCLMYHPRMYGDVTGMGLASWEHTKEIVKEAYKDAEEAGEAFPTYTTFRPVELQTEERRDVIDRLALNLISERFRFPNIKQLVTELRQFEKTVSPSGKVKMSAPQGLHDDLVFAAALANQGLPRIKYTSSNTNMTRRQAGWEKL
jgi:hypothetical protein